MAQSLMSLAQNLGDELRSRSAKVTTAESCTGGGISYAITEIPGSSTWFEQAFITYSNSAKQHLLGVDPLLIEQHGAVSLPVVAAMARGAAERAGADYAMAVSGVAGPGGGTEAKPVGTVCVAWFGPAFADEQVFHFAGDRAEVRKQSIIEALAGLLRRMQKNTV